MLTKKKYKRSRGHRYDWGEFLQFMKDNPELMQAATSMVGNNNSQQAPQSQQPVDKGVTGQKTTWQGDGSLPMVGGLSTAFADLANAIGSISDKGNEPVAKTMGIPGNYYAEGGPSAYIGAATTGLNIASKAVKAGKGVDTKPYEEMARNFGNTGVTASDNQELLNAWSSRNYLKHLDKYDITGGNLAGDIIGGINDNVSDSVAGFQAGAGVGGVAGGIVGAILGGGANMAGQIVGAIKTKKNINRLNLEIDKANTRQDRMFEDAAERLKKQQLANTMYNYSAYGGPMNMPILDVMSYDLAKDRDYTQQIKAQSKNSTSFTPIFNSPSTYSFEDGGGIYIKPSKRGTFTAAAKKHGKSVQEFASQVLANKENYSPAMVKKANFARNASHWHDNGGMLMSDYFNNGVTMVDQGGTHENNPHEGVQMGIAPDGKPNLVEEGEAIYKDYVFSNRLRVPKEVRNKYKLRGPKDMTFAEVFRKAQEESEERPNDPISEEGLENIALVLARTQEAVRGYEKAGRKAAKGGYLFDGDVNPYPHGSQEWFEWEDEHPDTQFIDNAPKGSYAGIFGEENPTDPEDVTTVVSNPAESQNPKNKRKWFNPSNLRYADVLANAGAVFSDMMGLTNNPTLFDYIPPFQAVGYNPIGNYIPVTHFDTRYAANLAAQQAAATRRAIMQSSLPSRYANLLAADYNAQVANGDLLMKAALDDYDRAVKREEFNRGTNQVNSQLGLQTSLANQDARLKYAQSALQQAKMNVDESNVTMAAKAANLGNRAESLSNIGREADAKAWRDMLIRAGVYGTLSEKPTDWSPEQWEDYQKYIAKYRKSSAAKGGKLRKKRGLTY